jgi:hypothetical protein
MAPCPIVVKGENMTTKANTAIGQNRLSKSDKAVILRELMERAIKKRDDLESFIRVIRELLAVSVEDRLGNPHNLVAP